MFQVVIMHAQGSLIMDMVESHSDYMHLPGYDDRLTLWREWLAQRGESAALIEEQSLVRLGVASLSTDYPKGPGKGYAVKLMTAFVADSLKDTLGPVLQPCAALAWSVTKFQSVLDDADMWLSETQAFQALEAGTLYCQMYMHLAATALATARPGITLGRRCTASRAKRWAACEEDPS